MVLLKRAILAAALAGLAMLTGCTRLFFQPNRHLYAEPEDYGLLYEIVRFPSLDGTELTGMILHASSAPSKGTVVQFHGNGENMSSHFGYTFWLTAVGYDVFIFDYRGYGGSGGRPSEKGAVEDGIAALRFIRARPGLDPGRLFVWGQSLGGAVAIASLADDGGAGVKALVLESTFDSYKDMAQDVVSRSWLTWILQWPFRLAISDSYRPSDRLGRLPTVPILVIHGDADRIIPFRFGERLYRELREPKEFWKVEGGRHLEAFTRFASTYRPRLAAFLEKQGGLP